MSPLRRLAAVALPLLLIACGGEPEAEAHANVHDEAEASAEQPPGAVAVPPVVRRNLGITFATAEYRPVAHTLSVPGRFVLRADAQHHYPLPASGRVTIHVAAHQVIEPGQLLLEVDAPDWRALQLELASTRAERASAEAELARAKASQLAARGLTDEEELSKLPDVYGAAIHAAELTAEAADTRHGRLLAKAATLTAIPVAELAAKIDGVPAWERLEHIPVRAVGGGVVREVDAASGTWVDAGTEVVHVVRPQGVHFHGRALQADLFDRLRDGQTARIAPPEGRGEGRRAEPVAGRIHLGVSGDADSRTVDLIVEFEGDLDQHWIRPQVAAIAEVVIDGDPALEELAIPLRAVVTDGLERVFFRRDPGDPDRVLRTVADLGPTDGRWVVVNSGLAEGHQVVVDGAYQLKLATTGRDLKAGHFHADGTWHEEDH